MMLLGLYIQPASASEDRNQYLYQDYYNKLMELQEQFGQASIVSSGEYESWLSGLCFAKLIDFNGDGTAELLLSYLDSVNEYGYPEYVVEVWEHNGKEIEKVFEGDSYFNEEIYASVKLFSYGDKYFIGQSFSGAEECAEWPKESSGLQWISGFGLYGYAGDEFDMVQSLIHGYSSDSHDWYNLNGESMLAEDMGSSESYNEWLAYIENNEIFLLTCDADSSELEKTIGVLEDTFSTLHGADDSTEQEIWMNGNEEELGYYEGVYCSDENRLMIVKNEEGYKAAMLIFRLTTFLSTGYTDNGIMFLYDGDLDVNYHIEWIDENTCVYTFDDDTFPSYGIMAGTSYTFVRSDTETIADYDFIW